MSKMSDDGAGRSVVRLPGILLLVFMVLPGVAHAFGSGDDPGLPDDGTRRFVAAERGVPAPERGRGALGDRAEVVLFSDDFEGTFPGTAWSVNTNPAGPGWGRWSCWSTSGSFSVGCAENGTGAIGCGDSYPDGMETWMLHGPFSLASSTYESAAFRVQLNLDSESDHDEFYIGYSTDGSSFQGLFYSGAQVGRVELDLAGVMGEEQVWVACVFRSDTGTARPNGAQVDDAELVVETDAANELALGETQGPSGSVVSVPLQLDNDATVKAFQLDVIYDAGVASLAGAEASERGLGMTVEHGDVAPGRGRVVGYYDDAGSLASGSGEIARISFRLVGSGGATTVLTPSGVVLAGVEAESLPVTSVAGSLRVEAAAGPPTVHIAVLRNPGRERRLQVFVTVGNGSGDAPTVTADGAALAVRSLGDGVYVGDLYVADAAASLALAAEAVNVNGTGNAQTTVTFGR